MPIDPQKRARAAYGGVWMRLGTVGLWYLLASGCFAATVNTQYVIDSWTSENGLPQNSVLSIGQTADGYLWLTTFDGLVRFDGVRFTMFKKGSSSGLTSSRFVELFAEQDGTLWASTEDRGLIRYRDGRFQALTTANGLPSDSVIGIQRGVDGSLLIETRSRLSHLANGRIIREAPRNFRQHKTYVSPRGARWDLDCTGLRLTMNGHETSYKLPFDPRHISPDPGYSYITYVQMDETPDAALWLAVSGGLYRLAGGALTSWTQQDGMPQSSITALMHDNQGHIWLGTSKDGACRFDTGRFDCYTTANGLSDDHVRSIYQDREGDIWVGTNNRGINRLTRRVVTPLSTAAGLPEKSVYPILEDRAGDVWLGTGYALTQTRAGRVIGVFRRSDGWLYGEIQSLYEDRLGRLWVGGDGGIEYYSHGRFTDFTQHLKLGTGSYGYWFIHEDRTGALWFGTSAGLLRYQDGLVHRYTTADGLPSNNVQVVEEAHDGTLWVGTRGGLARLDGKRFVAYTERDGLASNYVRALYEDARGTMWIGTYDGGLSRLSGGVLTNYTTATGLFSDGVFKILEDAHGNFWMSSNQGIYRVSRRQLEDFAAARISRIRCTPFGKSDGMLNVECNGGRQQAGIKARDGKLWFATQDGAAIIDPEAVPYNRLPPPVVIESSQVQGRGMPLTGELRLQPNDRNLEIRYTGLSLIKPEYVRFRYRLEGLDSAWVEAGTRRTAFYPYLPPGRYVFRVTAANSDLVWNERGSVLAIRVLPPFYRTWWFMTLAALLASGMIRLLWKNRLSQLERAHALQQAFSRRLIENQEAERQRMAAELHDSLGQHLLIIKNRAALGVRMADDQARAKQQFDEITSSAGSAIDEVRQIAYNLRPLNLERLGLTAVIEELIENVSDASGIQFSVAIIPLEGLLPPEGAINLYRIIQESINNIVRHAQATKASLEIWRENSEVHITVADNGRGFSLDSPARRGLGLTSVTERVRILGGVHTVASRAGQGTTLSIRIPEAARGGIASDA